MVDRPGHLNTKADILSRHQDYADEERSDPTPKSVFKLGQWIVGTAQIVSIKAFAIPVSIEDKQRAAGKRDPDWVATLEAVTPLGLTPMREQA